MPIYDYECRLCHDISEQFQRIGDPPPQVCEKCGGIESMSKVMSKSSFQLKGGGWYKDLYSSAKPRETSN